MKIKNLLKHYYHKKTLKTIARRNGFHIYRLKLLSPDGKSKPPDHVSYAKGQWYRQAALNKNRFVFDDPQAELFKIYSLKDRSLCFNQGGGLLMFPADDC